MYPPGVGSLLPGGPRTPADLAAGKATVQAGRLFIVGILWRTPRLKPPACAAGLPYRIAKDEDNLLIDSLKEAKHQQIVARL